MTNLDNLRKALSTLAAIVGQEDELRGRVRLQKIGYLLQQRGFEPLEHVRFSYHHYGPYSDQFAGVLEQSVASGLVREEAHRVGSGRKQFAYTLDRDHGDVPHLQLSAPDSAELDVFMGMTRDAHYRTLELAATVVYLERNLTLPREAAFQRALGLKPDCKGHRDHADILLGELGFVA